MLNETQVVFQNFPVGPLEGVPEKIYLDKLGTYFNGQTAGIHSNEGGGKLCYVSISAQKSVYATQSCSTSFPVSTDPGGTVTYPSRNIMAAVLSATTRANEENIRI